MLIPPSTINKITSENKVRTLDASTAVGQMRDIGASVWRGYGSARALYPELPFPTPLPSDAAHDLNSTSMSSVTHVQLKERVLKIDMRPTAGWILRESITYLVASVCWAGFGCFGYLKQSAKASFFLKMLFCTNSVSSFSEMMLWLQSF